MKKYFYKQKGLVLSVVFMNVLSAGMAAYIALILRDILDIALSLDLEGFRSALIFSAIFFLLLGVVSYLTESLNAKLIAKIIRNIREDVFRGMMRQEMSQFKAVNSADYISALTNDIKLVEENYLLPLISVIYYIATPIIAIALMFYFSPIVAVAVLVSLIFLIVIPALFSGGIEKRQENLSQQLSLFTVKIKDIFSGFEVIKSYQMHKHIDSNFKEQNKGVFKSKLSLDYLYALTTAISSLLGLFSQVGTIFLSAYLIIQGNLTAGALLAIVQISGQITGPIQVLADSVPKIKGSKAVIERLEKFSTQQPSNRGSKTATFEESLTIKDFEFTYPNQEKPVLKNLNFTFEKNKKYVLIGKSGCGKTTLTKALIGHISGYQGEIFYDQVNLNKLSDESTGNLSSMIHQNVYMFDEDIDKNIRLHKSYSKERLTDAIKNSGVHLFLKGSKTLESKVGENGANLSGGQRQRIAVARALIQNKPLLILDEGTSAVDKQTAHDIESRLLNRDDLTLLTITHSLNPEILSHYDEVIFMEDGEIAESGSFDYLMNTQGKFYQYYSA